MFLSDAVPSQSPQNIRCTAVSSQSLQVSWEPPLESNFNGVLKGYKISWESADSWADSFKSETKITTALNVVIHGLEKYTNYSIQASAMTRAGDGVLSEPLYCLTEEDTPEVPAAVKAVVSSVASVIISWLPPLKSNGKITGYNLHMRNLSAKSKWYRRPLLPQQTNYLAENLHKGTQYEFSVAAMTSVGEGPQTASIIVSPSNEGKQLNLD